MRSHTEMELEFLSAVYKLTIAILSGLAVLLAALVLLLVF